MASSVQLPRRPTRRFARTSSPDIGVAVKDGCGDAGWVRVQLLGKSREGDQARLSAVAEVPAG
jgi:hypothetical protein